MEDVLPSPQMVKPLNETHHERIRDKWLRSNKSQDTNSTHEANVNIPTKAEKPGAPEENGKIHVEALSYSQRLWKAANIRTTINTGINILSPIP